MNQDFQGRRAIVTGAAHGFGRAICVALATRGAEVWGCDIIETELAETAGSDWEATGRCH